MTLTKQEIGSGYPLFRKQEAEKSIKVKVISEDRMVKTQYNPEQTVIDIELAKIPLTKEQYEDILDDPQGNEVERRLESAKRSWMIGATVINWLVEKHGKDGKLDSENLPEIEFEVKYFKMNGWKGIYPVDMEND